MLVWPKRQSAQTLNILSVTTPSPPGADEVAITTQRGTPRSARRPGSRQTPSRPAGSPSRRRRASGDHVIRGHAPRPGPGERSSRHRPMRCQPSGDANPSQVSPPSSLLPTPILTGNPQAVCCGRVTRRGAARRGVRNHAAPSALTSHSDWFRQISAKNESCPRCRNYWRTF